MKTTFERIKSFNPCTEGWKKLIGYYKPESLTEEIDINDIVKSNNIRDAIWAMRAVEDKKPFTLFCADVAESVLHIYEKEYPENKAVRECINAVRLFVDDKISKEELRKKRSAADAAYAANAANAPHAAADAADAAAYAADAAAYAAYAAANAADADAAAADAAAYAAYAAAYAANAADAAYNAADAAADTRDEKWQEITELLKKY